MFDTDGARSRRRRALVTLADVAWPLDAGKRLRAVSVVRALAVHYDLDVAVLFADADATQNPMPPDVRARARVLSPAPRSAVKALQRVLLDRVPWQTAVQDWDVVREQTARTFTGPYDLAWFGALDHFDQLHRAVDAHCRIVDCDDVETTKLEGFIRLSRSESLSWVDRLQRRIEIPLWRRIQRQVVRHADHVVVCSELDRRRLLAQSGPPGTPRGRVVALPNTYPEPEPGFVHAPADPPRFVVIANYGTDQNLDAATWAAHQIVPQLRAAMPDATLRLVGRRIDRISHLRGVDGLELVGHVDSVAEELRQALAVIVPIRFGGGTRLKILEALAYGVPVITTTMGCEGIESVTDAMLVADTAQDLVGAAQRLASDPELAQRLVRAGHALYQRSYSPAGASAVIEAMLA